MVERLLVAISGPLLSTLLGTIVFGLLLFRLGDRATARRAADDRRRDEVALATRVIHDRLAEITEVSATFYGALQAYWRQSHDVLAPGDLARARTRLDEHYRNYCVAASVVEDRLRAYFESDLPRETWHKIDDLLTVRYFQLTGRDTPMLRARNAKGYEGEEHSGLTTTELADGRKVLDAYYRARTDLPTILLSAKLREATLTT
jgi:hypothetical protein